MSLINIANGNPHQEFDVADLTDEQVANALGEAALVPELADQSYGDTDRAWLDHFCSLYAAHYDEVFTLP